MIVEKVEVTISWGFTENCYILSEGDGLGEVSGEKDGAASDDGAVAVAASSDEPACAAAASVIVVDPGAEVEKILAAIDGRRVEALVLTHRHYDHVGALSDLREATGATVIAHTLDAKSISGEEKENPAIAFRSAKPTPIDRLVEDGDVIALGASRIRVLHTPGHTIGSMCLYDEAGGVLISGDTIFFEAVGRTDFPTGSVEQQRESLQVLAKLPDATIIYPGHDASTTIAHEKQYGVLRGIA
jgi:glyoxylase-like metal-dependent hydrolase (beta-lactamase superfamily II)